MKIAYLLLGCTLIATIASAQEAPVHVTGVMLPGPAGQGGPAHADVNQVGVNQPVQGAGVTNASPAPRTATINPRLGSIQSLSTPSGIVYTCDANINALPGVCNTLNTTIAGLYASTFANANASIYITFGTTGLGAERVLLFLCPVTVACGHALQSNETDADDITAFKNSVPATNPINGNSQFAINPANYRALGFTTPTGLQADGTQCTLGATGCYDGIITISNTMALGGNLYFRTGTIASNQYDFYTVVEHETDEVLGTGSCAFGCPGSVSFAPADLFRYQSNGTRSFAPGNNSFCSVVNTGNACFSLDGVHMLQPYNNLANGGDAGDWTPNCLQPLVQNAEGCPGIAGVDISRAAEIRVLDVIGYTLNVSVPAPVTVTTKLTSNTTGIVNGVCNTPPQITTFTITSPQVYLYFLVTGANVGDTAQMTFIRPDGVVYTTLNSSPLPSSGSFCFSPSININGTAAASYPGTWTIQVFWNHSNSPLFALSFTLSASSVTVTTKLTSNTTGIVNGLCNLRHPSPTSRLSRRRCGSTLRSREQMWGTPRKFNLCALMAWSTQVSTLRFRRLATTDRNASPTASISMELRPPPIREFGAFGCSGTSRARLFLL